MSIVNMLKSVMATARGIGGGAVMLARKHAPEILVGSGVVGFGITIVASVKATNKAHDILEDKEKQEEKVRVCLDDMLLRERYTPEDAEKDMKMIAVQTRWRIFKAYLPVVTMGGLSIASVLGGYRILNTRYVGAAAAYKALEAGFDRYRGNVIDRFGKEVDSELFHGIKADEMEEAQKERRENQLIKAENKGKKLLKKKQKRRYSHINDMIFDEYSDRWQRWWTPEQAWQYLTHIQDEMNDKLRINKHLFVNEVRDRLGLERIPSGQVEGWILTRNNPDSKVDFGLESMPEEQVREIISTHRNEDIRIPLTLNPDGIIYTMINDREFLDI